MDYVDTNGQRIGDARVYGVKIGEITLIELLNGRVMLAGADHRKYDIVPESVISNALAEILSARLAENPSSVG